MYKQKGALFGLDARIALLIYGIISTIIVSFGITILTEIDYSRVFSDANVISRGVKLYMRDVKTSIDKTVSNSLSTDDKELMAFTNLIKVTGVQSPYNTRWNGPYINISYENNNDPILEKPFRLVKLSKTYSTSCGTDSNPCYIFLKYKDVEEKKCNKLEKLATAKNINTLHRVGSADCTLYIKLTADY